MALSMLFTTGSCNTRKKKKADTTCSVEFIFLLKALCAQQLLLKLRHNNYRNVVHYGYCMWQ